MSFDSRSHRLTDRLTPILAWTRTPTSMSYWSLQLSRLYSLTFRIVVVQSLCVDIRNLCARRWFARMQVAAVKCLANNQVARDEWPHKYHVTWISRDLGCGGVQRPATDSRQHCRWMRVGAPSQLRCGCLHPVYRRRTSLHLTYFVYNSRRSTRSLGSLSELSSYTRSLRVCQHQLDRHGPCTRRSGQAEAPSTNTATTTHSSLRHRVCTRIG